MNKQNIKITVVSERLYSLPDGLQDIIAWFNRNLDSIPEEYRSSAQVEFDCDDYSREVNITYSRPETDEEAAARRCREDNYKASEIRRLEAQLAQLKRS